MKAMPHVLTALISETRQDILMQAGHSVSLFSRIGEHRAKKREDRQ
jgi:hypothetical protein